MKVEILYRPSYSAVNVTLEQNEGIRTEPGAMVGMTAQVQVETRMQGGLLKSLARSVLGGESFFTNTFRGAARDAQVMLAPSLPGDVQQLELRDQAYLVRSGSFLACAESVEVDTKWSGARTFFWR